MSVDAWQVLGLAPTDDLRALKRAYAACLKRCRPEDDAEGFARLRGAYEFLLAHLGTAPASRSSRPGTTNIVELSPPAGTGSPVAPIEIAAAPPSAPPPMPMPMPMPASRAPQQVAAEVLTRACQAQGHDATVAFAAWLAVNPELMLLDGKPLISRLVLARILRGQTPTPEAFDKLEAFFHWDDRVEQRRLAQAGVPVESALTEVRAAQLRRELAKGVARKAPHECRLDAIRRAGTGWRAWWLALVRRSPYTVPQLLRDIIQIHGYRAVEQVFGTEVMAFWERAISQRPSRLQWFIATVRPLLVGMLLVVSGVILGAIVAWIATQPGQRFAVDAFSGTVAIMATIGAAVVAFVGLPQVIQLAWRGLQQGPLQKTLARWHDLRERCALDRRWRTALPATALLLVTGWFWPASVNPMPFIILVAVLLLLHLRDMRSVIGLGFMTLGALPLCMLHGAVQPLIAALLLPALWLGHATHGLLSRRRRAPGLGNTVMVMGLMLAVAMLVAAACLGDF